MTINLNKILLIELNFSIRKILTMLLFKILKKMKVAKNKPIKINLYQTYMEQSKINKMKKIKQYYNWNLIFYTISNQTVYFSKIADLSS